MRTRPCRPLVIARAVLALCVLTAALAPPAQAATCLELETRLNANIKAHEDWLRANPNVSVCTSMDRLAALMDEAIVLHEQCSAELDPTGEQLTAYRDTQASIRAGQQQLCNG